MPTVLTRVISDLLVALAGGLIAQMIARWTELPDIVFFVLTGIILGPQGLHVFQLAPSTTVSDVVFTLGSLAMLYEGGRSIELAVMAKIWRGTLILATLGVLVTTAIMAVAIHFLLGQSWLVATLIAAVLASTDPATIIPLFQQVRLQARLAQLVQAESAFNDATSSALSLLLMAMVLGGPVHLAHAFGQFARLMVGGLLVGGISSYALNLLLSQRRYRRLVLDSLEHPVIISLAIVLISYLMAVWLGASGFMAAFTAGVVTGNAEALGVGIPGSHGVAHENYLFTNATVIRMLIFILLGSQVNFLAVWHLLLPGLAVMVVFLFLSRPATVFLCLPLDFGGRWTLRELAFVSWVRETGVMPAALAGMFAALGVPGAATLSSLVFLAVLLTIIVQGASTGWWARRLRLSQ